MNRSELHNAIVAAGMGEILSQLDEVILAAIELRNDASTSDAIALGCSKRYGQPDLPPDFLWPTDASGTPWGFVAQINLAEVAPFDVEKCLPATGLLSFFLSLDGEGANRVGNSGVYYFPEIAPLLRREPPAMHGTGHDECRVRFSSFWDIPHFGNHPDGKFEFLGNRLLPDFIETMRARVTATYLLGQPDDYQGELEPLCEAIFIGRPITELTSAVRRQSYRDWICLFSESEFSGGVFTHNWLTRREHLARADFSQTIRIDVN